METVSPYHTNSQEYPPSHREVYRDKDSCPDGKRIKPQHKEQGTTIYGTIRNVNMLKLRNAIAVLVLAGPTVLCQPLSIPGVDEPPELCGPPKKFDSPSPIILEFSKIMENWKENDAERIKASRIAFSGFLEEHPNFSPAYAMRADLPSKSSSGHN
jgi:hypothetical protein